MQFLLPIFNFLRPFLKYIVVGAIIALAAIHYVNLRNKLDTLQSEKIQLELSLSTQKETIKSLQKDIDKITKANNNISKEVNRQNISNKQLETTLETLEKNAEYKENINKILHDRIISLEIISSRHNINSTF